MKWLFVIGGGAEIAGALLLVAPLLLPILLAKWEKLALQGYLFPLGGVEPEDLENASFAIVGALLLVAGFSTQLAGYVVEFDNDYLIAVALAVVFGALLAGGLFAKGLLTKWLLSKAMANDPVQQQRLEEARPREEADA